MLHIVSKRSSAPAAEKQKKVLHYFGAGGIAIIERHHRSGAINSQGEEHIPWVQHSELDNCMLLDILIQT